MLRPICSRANSNLKRTLTAVRLPVKWMVKSLKAMTNADFRAMKRGVDLNSGCQSGYSSGLLPGGCDERRQDAIRPTHGFLAMDELGPLRRRQGCSLSDLRGNIPSFIHVSEGKLHDVHALDLLVTEPGTNYVMDRGYLDFGRLHVLPSRLFGEDESRYRHHLRSKDLLRWFLHEARLILFYRYCQSLFARRCPCRGNLVFGALTHGRPER
jgi:hypothetical protein